MLTISLSLLTLNSSRSLLAGPLATWPEVLNLDPWQVHSKRESENVQLVEHPWWVQTLVKARMFWPSTFTANVFASLISNHPPSWFKLLTELQINQR